MHRLFQARPVPDDTKTDQSHRFLVTSLYLTFIIMENQLKTVEMIMLGFAVAYFLFEVYLNVNNIRNDTSNTILLRWTRKKRLIFLPFAIGAIGGHLFLGTSDDTFRFCDGMMPVLLLGGICVVLLLIGLFVLRKDKAVSRPFMTLLLALGFAYGHWVWSMNYTGTKCPPPAPRDCDCFNYSPCNKDCHANQNQ